MAMLRGMGMMMTLDERGGDGERDEDLDSSFCESHKSTSSVFTAQHSGRVDKGRPEFFGRTESEVGPVAWDCDCEMLPKLRTIYSIKISRASVTSKKGGGGNSPLVDRSFEYPECSTKDVACIEEHREKDRLGKEAIMMLHRQMDDDHDGDVEPSESDEFLRDELKYVDDFERHSQLHRNDKEISAEELWKSWKYSEVYNWTVDKTAKWLEDSVDLPQYAERFQNNGIEGSALPRLAANSHQFMSTILGITDPLHRQKISVKAMDVVLFGPPKGRFCREESPSCPFQPTGSMFPVLLHPVLK
nr:stromal interaction molecule homolog [Lytechinus pictus]